MRSAQELVESYRKQVEAEAYLRRHDPAGLEDLCRLLRRRGLGSLFDGVGIRRDTIGTEQEILVVHLTRRDVPLMWRGRPVEVAIDGP